MQGNVYNDIFAIFTITNDEYSNYLAFQLTVIRDSFSIKAFDKISVNRNSTHLQAVCQSFFFIYTYFYWKPAFTSINTVLNYATAVFQLFSFLCGTLEQRNQKKKKNISQEQRGERKNTKIKNMNK